MTYTPVDEFCPPAGGAELANLNRSLATLPERHDPPIEAVQVIEIDGLDLNELGRAMRLVTACEINADGPG